MSEVVGTIVVDAEINTANFQAGAAKIQRSASNLANDVDKKGSRAFRNFSSNASSAFDGVANSIANLAKVTTGLLIGGAFGIGQFIKQAGELESISASFESLTGSSEAAKDVLGQLYKYSFATAFSTEAINKGARDLLASNVAVEDLTDVLSMVGDVAGATGADLSNVMLPFTQSLSKGKLDLMDFRQMMNAGAGAIKKDLVEVVAEQGFGSLEDAFQAGGVSSDMMLEAFRRASREGGFAFEGALKQSKTFNGQLSNLQETIGNVGLELLGVDKATGNIDPEGVFAKMSKAVGEATKWLDENKEKIKEVGMVIIDNLIPAVSGIATAFIAAKVAAIAFSIAANANVFSLIVIAIVAVIGVLTFLQVKFNIFGRAWEKLKTAIQPVVDMFNTKVMPVLRIIGNFIKDVFVKALERLREAWAKIQPLVEKLMPVLKVLGVILLVSVVAPIAFVVAGIIIAIAIFVALATAVAWVTGKLAQGITWLVDKFKQKWDKLKEDVGKIVNVFKALPEAFRIIFNKVWDKIKGAFKDVVGFFQGIWDKIVGVFGSIGTAVGNAIGGAFKTVINTVLRTAVGFINGFINAINGAIGLINKIPGVNIGLIGTLEVPQLAEGGIVTQPTLAMVGEGRESEAVIPLSKLDEMLSGEGGGKNSGYNITVNMSGIMTSSPSDERAVARRLVERLNEELKSKGKMELAI